LTRAFLDVLNLGQLSWATGQNIDAWGRDMEPKQRFADLLDFVCDVSGLERVRFATSHPVSLHTSTLSQFLKNCKLILSEVNELTTFLFLLFLNLFARMF
jgi:hypothetical protein